VKVLIFHESFAGSTSADVADTQIEVNLVTKALKHAGHTCMDEEFTLDLIRDKALLDRLAPDKVFNLVETLDGSRLLHLAPAVFEDCMVPYTGGNQLGMLLSSDKLLGKEAMKLAGIPSPAYADCREIDPTLVGIPVIVKPRCEDASVGIDGNLQTFSTREEMQTFLVDHPQLFCEKYIDGREFNVSLLSHGNEVKIFPFAELRFIDYPSGKPRILDYDAKWTKDSFSYRHTVRTFKLEDFGQPMLDRMRRISLSCWKLFGAKGYMRVDFRVDGNDIHVLEVNVNPCIADDSGFVAAAAEAGIAYGDLVSALLGE
jgi:D-alanine-D-alanine ligase